jgi:DNA-binding transcriptional LysR family regulator
MINPVWLKTFCTLADIGHFTQTAKLLFMTQSGVSQHIQKLEQQLGTLLLIRDGKSFLLTESGEKLYRKGKRLLNTLIELETSVKNDEPFSGTVKIASPGSIGLKLYPHLLDIQTHHKNLVIDYSFAPNSDIETKIMERKIDFGLLTERSKNKQITCEKIGVEPLVLVTPNDIKTITWEQLLLLGFINHPDASHHASLLLSENFPAFEHSEQFTCKGFSNQISLILEPVSRGLGFTILPLNAVNAFHTPSKIRIHTLEHVVSESLFLCRHAKAFETKRSRYVKSIISDFMKE